MDHTVVLFGEAAKGDFQMGYFCKTLADLSDHLGEPPSKEAKGLMFAIQALMYKRDVLYFRVHEEGFSTNDYLKGLSSLEQWKTLPSLTAICLPGVGDAAIIDATLPVCQKHRSFLILTEQDLYDYMTCRYNDI
jgi:hypothetical protein